MIIISAHSVANTDLQWKENAPFYATALAIQALGLCASLGLYFLGRNSVASASLAAFTLAFPEAMVSLHLNSRHEFEEKERPAPPSDTLPIDKDTLGHVYDYLSIQDIGRMALVGKRFHELAQVALLRRAQEFGYKGKHFGQRAKNHLVNIRRGVKRLFADEVLLYKHVVFNGKKLDTEATLRRLFSLSQMEAHYLRLQLLEAEKRPSSETALYACRILAGTP